MGDLHPSRRTMAVAAVVLLASAVLAAVMLAPAAVPIGEDRGASYSVDGGKVIMTSGHAGEFYEWTVTDEDGRDWHSSSSSPSSVWELGDGGYHIMLVVTSSGVKDPHKDWIRVASGSVWDGFATQLSGDSVTVSDNTGSADRTWTVYDDLHTAYEGLGPTAGVYKGVDHGSSPSMTIGSDTGLYHIVMSSVGDDGVRTEYHDYCIIDGSFEKPFAWSYTKWSYGGSDAGVPKDFSVTVSFTLSDILRASYYGAADRDVRLWGDYSGITGTIDPDGVAADIEGQLRTLYTGAYGADASLTGQGYADFILAFVLEAIDYPPTPIGGGTDTYIYGSEEYWALPIQTVYHGKGDCEDTSALCASLYACAGYSTGIGIKPGHAYAIVALDEYTEVTDYSDVIHNGRSYTEFIQYGSNNLIYYTCDTYHDNFVLPVGFLSNDGHSRTYFTYN
jgi:hypothetical protein